MFGNAVKLNSNALLTSGLGFNCGQDFTIAVWVKFDNLATGLGFNQNIIHQQDVDGQSKGRVHIELPQNHPDVKDKISSYTGGKRISAESDAVIDTWYHVTVVKDVANNSRKLYIDGTLASSEENDAEINDGEVVIGANKEMKGSFVQNGYLDDLLITQEALDETTIMALKNNGVKAVLAISTNHNTYTVKSSFSSYYSKGFLHLQAAENISKAKVIIYSVSGKIERQKSIDFSNSSSYIK